MLRPIRDSESQLIERILTCHCAPSKAIVPIVPGALVEEIPDEGTIRFVSESILQHPQEKYPVEAESMDEDGIALHALLFVRGKHISELEIFKDDSSPILQIPRAEAWRCV